MVLSQVLSLLPLTPTDTPNHRDAPETHGQEEPLPISIHTCDHSEAVSPKTLAECRTDLHLSTPAAPRPPLISAAEDDDRNPETAAPSADARVSSAPCSNTRCMASNFAAAFAGRALWTLRRQVNSTKVVAVGGSYGGMLTAWLRKRHPDLVSAALASSAPVVGFASTLMEKQRAADFYAITESAYPCSETLGAAFRALWAAPADAWERLGDDFGLCSSSRIHNATSLEALVGFLQQQLSDIAFANYPYPVGDMPANPAAYACSKTRATAAHRPTPQASGRSLGGHRGGANREPPTPTPSLAADGWLPLRDALAWRYLPAGGCIALRGAFSAYTPGFLPGAWTFQRCTDLVMAFEVRDSSRMFLRCGADGFSANCAAAGLDALRSFCAAEFGVQVPDAARQQAVWGQNWTRASGGSRIIFSNGDLDPWGYGGVDDDVQAHDDDPDRPVVLHIAKGAHHLDLRAPDPADPPSVVIAREQETAVLARWLDM